MNGLSKQLALFPFFSTENDNKFIDESLITVGQDEVRTTTDLKILLPKQVRDSVLKNYWHFLKIR